MPTNSTYENMLTRLAGAAIYSPDLPDETAESTLRALWLTAAGDPCSAQEAIKRQLPNLNPEQQSALDALVEERLCNIPLANLTGRVNFLGLELLYEPGVLAPRPETEILGYAASEIAGRIGRQSDTLLGIDMGCGCGNLSCALAARHRSLRLMSIDITDNCVAMTRRNVAFLNLGERITVFHGDLFAPLMDLDIHGNVDFIVSNPPYIPSNKLQSDLSHLLDHEPREAFDGGVYGFALHQRLIRESHGLLKRGGYLLFEFGLGQHKQIDALFRRAKGYSPVEYKTDDNGNPRVAVSCKV